VDVIAAPDADLSVASAATGHVDDDDPHDAVIIRDNICHACDSANSPARTNRKVHQIDWLQCDKCPRWYHVVCCPRLLTVV